MVLYLIRHGETTWNRQKRYFGEADIILTPQGMKQGKKLRIKLKKVRINRIYTSPSRRAYDFAGLIFQGKRLIKTPGLKEFGFGIFEGMTHRQLMKKHPGLYRRWLRDPVANKIPGGESFTRFRKRVLRSLRRILGKNRGNAVAIITHGGPIKIILDAVCKNLEFSEYVPGLAGIVKIRFEKDQPLHH